MDSSQPDNENYPDLEQLWQFAGQGLRSSDFNTAMVHFYRGELTRSNVWRSRLDATTNWAVITTGATLSFAFSSPQNTPIVLIINTLFVLFFLFIEARRYRYYELWTYRVRIMEQNFFTGLLSPPFLPHSDWANRLTESLTRPRFPISLMEAFGRRYRRNYAPIFLILAVSWIVKIFIHPVETSSWAEFMSRAQIGPVSGLIVFGTGVVFHAILISVGFLSADLQASTAEVLTEHSGVGGQLRRLWHGVMHEVLETERPYLPWLDSRKQMAFIISDEADRVGKALLHDLQRGVTLLHGTGLYTGQEHGVLLCTFQAKQLPLLKKAIKERDPKAFLIITAVQDVHGGGFRPLEA